MQAELAEQAGRDAPPSCAEAVVRRDMSTVSAGLISAFPEQPGYWNCIHLSGNRGSCWEEELKVRQHQAPADAELLAIPEPGAHSSLSVRPCGSCSALINLRDPGPCVSLLPAQGPLLPCRVRLGDPNSSPYNGLRSSQLLLLLEMKGWRQPAWTSWAGVTAFLAKPCAWPALLKPWEGSSLATQCLPSPQGFMKSSSSCGVTCEGQDVGVGHGRLCCGHKITGGMHGVGSHSHRHQPCCCFHRPQPGNGAQWVPTAMISITLGC